MKIKVLKYDEELIINIQKGQQITNKMNSETHTKTHIETHYNQTFESQKQKILESSNREVIHHIQRFLNKTPPDFSIETLGASRQCSNVKMSKKKIQLTKNLIFGKADLQK